MFANNVRRGAMRLGVTSARTLIRPACAATVTGLRKCPSVSVANVAPIFAATQARSLHASGEDSEIYYPASSATIQEPAPGFMAKAVVDGEIVDISTEDYKGKWVVLLFYPKDWTFVCPTEIIAFSDRNKEFTDLNAHVLAISTDTEDSHLAWTRHPRKRGGLGHMQIPLVADPTKSISANYGVLMPTLGIALRGLFIINPEGVLEQVTINNLGIGRSVDETLRLIQAHQFLAEHGEVCPAGWKPGDRTMKPGLDASQEYFASGATESEDDPLAAGGKVTVISSPREYKDLVGDPDSMVVVDFVAPHCGKCRQMMPYVNELSEEYPGVKFAKFDTTEEGLSELSAELGIEALPAFRFFKGGKEVQDPVLGYKKKMLKEAVKALSGS